MASTIRVGRVSSIDYESGTYEVTYADRGRTVTQRMNAVSNGEYKMPRVGQMVSVFHTSNGTAAGTTMGTVWNRSNKPAEGYGTPKYASKATGADTSANSGTTGGTGSAAKADHKVGDIVDFTGSKHYTNANAASGTACKPGKAKITQVYQPGKAKHPYHIVAVSGGGSNVYGWVDAADIGGGRAHTVVRGDTLWALAKKYLGSGTRYKEIMQLNGMTSEIIRVGQVLKIPAK